jgi:hypothetical protein
VTPRTTHNRTGEGGDSSPIRPTYYGTAIGKKLVERGLTLTSFSREIGIDRSFVGHYVHGLKERIGSVARRTIHCELVKMGVLKLYCKRKKVTAGKSGCAK